MKNKIKILGIAFAMVAGLVACEKTYMEPKTPVQKEESVTEEKTPVLQARITQGSWKITSFQWKLRENNDHFKEYVFRFLPDGSVIASRGNLADKGKWAKGTVAFRLLFESKPLKELNSNKWNFYRETKDKFVLKGLSPYDNTSQFVVFERL